MEQNTTWKLNKMKYPIEIPYKTNTQLYQTMNHLMKFKKITPLKAEAVYKIRRLAARICELKKHGWNIKKTLKSDPMGRRYAQYDLKKPYNIHLHYLNTETQGPPYRNYGLQM